MGVKGARPGFGAQAAAWRTRLGLEDDADGGGVEEVGAHAVGHADEHVARRRVVLAHRRQHLDVAVRVVTVARETVGHLGGGRPRVESPNLVKLADWWRNCCIIVEKDAIVSGSGVVTGVASWRPMVAEQHLCETRCVR